MSPNFQRVVPLKQCVDKVLQGLTELPGGITNSMLSKIVD